MPEPSIPLAGADGTLAPKSLRFSSFYVYSPRAVGWVARASRCMCRRVKQSDSLWLPHYIGRVYRASLHDPQLAELFARGAVLIPVPRSGVTDTASWPALQLARALNVVGFSLPVWPVLRRRVAVRKSSTAPIAARPSVREHYASFGVVTVLAGVKRVVLVDDVITKGRTLLAAAARLREQLPNADVRAFALIRTLGFASRMDHLIEPSHGCISWVRNDARREP